MTIMLKLLLPLLFVSAASAQTVRVVPASAWVAPVAGAAIGAPLSGSGSASLDALSRPDLNGRFPFVSAPGLLVPLVSAIEARGLTPDAFNALPVEARANVLKTAAAVAEARADAVAADASRAAENVTAPSYEEAKRKVASAEALDFYLSAKRREQVAAARAALVAARPKLQALYDAYERELPGKIAAGELTARDFIRKTPEGWTARDESPETVYASLNELYRIRLGRLDERAGPWSAAEAGLIKDSLFRLDVARALEKEKRGSMREIERVATIREQEARSWERSYESMDMIRTSMRFTARRPRAEDFDTLIRLYAWALDHSRGPGERAHKLAAIARGAGGIPSWNDVEELRSAAHAAALWTKSVSAHFAGASTVLSALYAAGVHYGLLAEGPLVPLVSASVLLAACALLARFRELSLRRSAGQAKVDAYLSRSPVSP